MDPSRNTHFELLDVDWPFETFNILHQVCIQLLHVYVCPNVPVLSSDFLWWFVRHGWLGSRVGPRLKHELFKLLSLHPGKKWRQPIVTGILIIMMRAIMTGISLSESSSVFDSKTNYTSAMFGIPVQRASCLCISCMNNLKNESQVKSAIVCTPRPKYMTSENAM